MSCLPERKYPRQSLFVYRQGLPVSITLCSAKRRPILTGPQISQALQSLISEGAETESIDVIAWCIMPDHIHVLLAPKVGGDVIAWVKTFKGRATVAARKLGTRQLWQRSFYDQVLRSSESERQVALYIFNNPVRAGLVQCWRDWPYLGSGRWDLRDGL